MLQVAAEPGDVGKAELDVGDRGPVVQVFPDEQRPTAQLDGLVVLAEMLERDGSTNERGRFAALSYPGLSMWRARGG